MSELKPLNITDDRTPEQVRADGDERWPDGRPYIKDGVCCVCLMPAPEPVHVCLIKLKEPEECGIHDLAQEPQKCTGLAYWTTDAASLCDQCIINILETTPDNRSWLAPALADIRERHLKIGARVRIQAAGRMRGELGTVYAHLPARPCPWHVRPDIWPKGSPGIAYLSEELDVIL